MRTRAALSLLGLPALALLSACDGGQVKMDPPPAGTMSKPDIEATWAPGCFGAFLDLVVGKPGNESAYQLPWIGIYDGELTPVFHDSGYRVSSDEPDRTPNRWAALLGSGEEAEEAPAIADLSPFMLVEGEPLDPAALSADLSGADAIFVKYSADWCVPCKLQSAQVQRYRELFPGERVVHVEIEADFMPLRDMPKDERPACAIEPTET